MELFSLGNSQLSISLCKIFLLLYKQEPLQAVLLQSVKFVQKTSVFCSRLQRRKKEMYQK